MYKKTAIIDPEVELGTLAVYVPEKTVNLRVFSDVHIEAHSTKMKKLKEDVAAAKREGAVVILLGDILDTAIRDSKGFYHGAISPEKALDMAEEVFEPVASQVKLIIPGNHERRVERVSGMDLTARFAERLGRADFYRSGPTVLSLKFYPRKQIRGERRKEESMWSTCKIFAHHGHGGGSRPGGAINRMEDLAKVVPDCDLYLMGHVHRKFAYGDVVHLGWPLSEHRRLFVCTGTYQGYEKYVQDIGLAPGRSEGAPLIHIKRCQYRDGRARDTVDVTAEV